MTVKRLLLVTGLALVLCGCGPAPSTEVISAVVAKDDAVVHTLNASALLRVQKIAVTSLTFDVRVPTKVNNKETLPGTPPKNAAAFLSEEEEGFVSDFLEDLILTLQKESAFRIQDARDFAKQPVYVQLPDQETPSYLFVPSPFRNKRLEVATANAALAESLGVDAFARLAFQFKQIKDTKGTRLQLVGDVWVYDVSGTLLLWATQSGDTTPLKGTITEMGPYLKVDYKHLGVYQEAVDQFLNHLIAVLNRARPKAK
ncbi:MAG: hypothetical protein AB7F28_02960 [Candidatus Margulisiibacteriota bacterium]